VKSEIEVPKGWNKVTLRHICKKITDGTHKTPKYVREGIPFLSTNNLIPFSKKFDFDNYCKYITKEEHEQLIKRCKPEKGDILVSKCGTIGRTQLIKNNLEFSIFVGLGLLKLNEEKIMGEFAEQLMNWEVTIRQMECLSPGATRKTLTINGISKLKILLPPLNEQQKIADILSKVDEQIDFTEKIISKNEELKKGLMQKLLTKGIGHTKFKKTEFGEIPEKWEIVKQGDIAEFINGRAYKLSEWEKSGTPVIRLQNLTGSGSTYYYSNLKLDPKQYVQEGNLLYMWSASFGPYIWHGPKAIYHYHIWKVECGDGIDKMYMFYNLHNMTNIMKNQMHGMAILHITKNKMEKQKIKLPPLDEQKQIALILSKVDEQIQDNKKELKHLHELKKGLMQDLLTGKVRVSV